MDEDKQEEDKLIFDDDDEMMIDHKVEYQKVQSSNYHIENSRQQVFENSDSEFDSQFQSESSEDGHHKAIEEKEISIQTSLKQEKKKTKSEETFIISDSGRKTKPISKKKIQVNKAEREPSGQNRGQNQRTLKAQGKKNIEDAKEKSLEIQQQIEAESNNQKQHLIERNTEIVEQQKKVQAGYENKQALTTLTRQVLETSDLRNFHNWIKGVMIRKYSEARKNYIKKEEDLSTIHNQLYVLEIACGMGGDLKKWLHAGIAFYIGIDIAFNSLQEAHRRAKEMMDGLRQDENHKRFRYGFYQKDGADNSEIFWKHILDQEQENDKNKKFYFDIVSCQMAMHYMFGSEKTARNFFQNASKRLNNFGYLLLTFSDANAIVKKMRSRSTYNSTLKKHIFENKYFSMAFDSLDFPVGQPYGLSYGFFLQDAVGEKDPITGAITYTPEYLVELSNLEKLALEFSLDLKENLNFIDFYKTYRNSYPELFKTMKLHNFTDDHQSIDKDLWEISHCYRVAIFQKVDPSGNKDKKYSFSRNTRSKHLFPEPVPQPPVGLPQNKLI